MNYTEKYHLPQWEETDRIMRADFNQMCADIEEGIAEAKSTADTAQAGAVEAAKLPYAVGSYVGNGSARTIVTGFQPSVVMIFTNQKNTNDYLVTGRFFAAGQVVTCDVVTMVDNGFQLPADDYTAGHFPVYNRPHEEYQYIAFR